MTLPVRMISIAAVGILITSASGGRYHGMLHRILLLKTPWINWHDGEGIIYNPRVGGFNLPVQ